MVETKKPINTICLECGDKYGKKDKASFGIWKDNCGLCHKKQVWCASAQHDFALYNDDLERIADEVQDLI